MTDFANKAVGGMVVSQSAGVYCVVNKTDKSDIFLCVVIWGRFTAVLPFLSLVKTVFADLSGLPPKLNAWSG